MKLFRSKQVVEIDEYTIKNEPILSIDLMERAATQIANWIIKRYNKKYEFKIFVGSGNNGGDALVVARHLAEHFYNVEVFMIKISNKLSIDSETNLLRLKEQKRAKIYYITSDNEIPDFNENAIVLDGLFGSGLSRPLESLAADTVIHINNQNVTVISVDSPSGLFGEDNSTNNRENIIKADYTLTVQFPNVSFMFYENNDFVGEWHVIPIGLHENKIETTETPYVLLENDIIKNIYKKRNKFSHKGNYGHALLISGSYGKMGAAVLASEACLRSGVGLLTTHVPKFGYNIMQTALPEAMISIDNSEKVFSNIPDLKLFNSIGIGPGLGIEKETKMAFEQIITEKKLSMVIDADGLNILAQNKGLLKKLPPKTILTPHPKEFERLFGKFNDSFSKNLAQIEFSKKYNIVIVLKGAHTAITTPDGKCYFNSTGNTGMATAGSGDVLTGIILSFLAQGYKPELAAIFGVYLHGLSADIAVEEIGEEALIAGDISENLGFAFNKIRK